MNSFKSYKHHLLPYLKKINDNTETKSHVNRLKEFKKQKDQIEFIELQKYDKDIELKQNGYKIVRNVFDCKNIHKLTNLANLYDVETVEFADKNEIFAPEINKNILSNEKFIREYKKIYGTDFLWQKVSIHRRSCDIGLPVVDTERSTAEHVDITETPNSELTITAYIALTAQTSYSSARLIVYPGSHLLNLKIPKFNFDYLSECVINMDVIGDLNERVEQNKTEAWIVDSLFYLLCTDNNKLDVLKSTLLLLAYNPELMKLKPKIINLNVGDVLFFQSNLLHGAMLQKDLFTSRISIAVRGSPNPYFEPSYIIDKCVSDDMYCFVCNELTNYKVPRNCFLFSGTDEMLSHYPVNNLIYNVRNLY